MRTGWIVAAFVLPAAAAAMAPGLPVADFPHDTHFSDLGIDCVTCHHETEAAPLAVPHEETFEHFADAWDSCKRCHRENSEPTMAQACSNCHHDSPVDIADETLSAKVVIHRSCWSCHEVGSGEAASRSCAQCHRAPAGGGQ